MTQMDSGFGKATADFLREIQNAAKQAESGEMGGISNTGDSSGAGFKQVMDSKQIEPTHQVPKVEGVKSTNVLLTATQQAQGINPANGNNEVFRVQQKMDLGLKNLFKEIAVGAEHIDGVIVDSLKGKSYSSQELLMLQATVYKFSQEMELASKVVEKLTGGIKQIMQTQL